MVNRVVLVGRFVKYTEIIKGFVKANGTLLVFDDF